MAPGFVAACTRGTPCSSPPPTHYAWQRKGPSRFHFKCCTRCGNCSPSSSQPEITHYFKWAFTESCCALLVTYIIALHQQENSFYWILISWQPSPWQPSPQHFIVHKTTTHLLTSSCLVSGREIAAYFSFHFCASTSKAATWCF